MDAALCAFPGLENAAKCLAVLHRRHQGVSLLKALGLGLFKQKAIRLFSHRASPEWNCSPSASHPFAPHPPPHLKHECGRECVFKRTVSSSPLSKLNNFGPEFICIRFQPGSPLDFGFGFRFPLLCLRLPKSQAFHLILLDRTDSFRCSIHCAIAFVIAFRTKRRGSEAVGWNRTHGTHIWRGKRRSNCLVAISTNDLHADTWDTRWEKMNQLKACNFQFPLQL